MKWFMAAVLLFFTITFWAYQKETPGARIDGTVVDAVTRQPLANVQLQLIPESRMAAGFSPFMANGQFQPVTSVAEGYANLASAEGQFIFDSVAPGNYVLLAGRAGYMTARLTHRTLPGNAGIPVSLQPGQRLESRVELFPAAMVSGAVVDRQGRPLQNVNVIAWRYAYDETGESAPRRIQEARTNDLGTFRFNNLDPGEYRFRIEPPARRTAASGAAMMYQAMYYPGAIDSFQAAPVRLESGVETRLGDIVLQESRGGALRVNAIDRTGAMPASGLAGARRRGDASGFSMSRSGEAIHVAPGVYDVYVSFLTPAGHASGAAAVEVTDRDVEVSVSVDFDARFSGRVTVESGLVEPGRPAAGVAVRLTDPLSLYSLPLQWTSAADGMFTDPFNQGLAPGRYRISILNVPGDMYVAALRHNGREISADWIVVERGVDVDLTVTLGESPGRVQGQALDASGEPVPGAVVVLISAEPSTAARYIAGAANGNGAFDLKTPPGAYSLYAWTELDGAAYRNAGFMQRVIEERGESGDVVIVEKGAIVIRNAVVIGTVEGMPR